jgi:hypothetical protein
MLIVLSPQSGARGIAYSDQSWTFTTPSRRLTDTDRQTRLRGRDRAGSLSIKHIEFKVGSVLALAVHDGL